ncbi:armadillo-type protein [Mycena capillaripes]|nr:armadillo-type protein [Mycena capillaripes]
MQPLARQPSRTSLLSWWSDNNPGLKGPTINIHAAAKPLARFLYHRQAMQFIKGISGVPLTRAVLEIYSTYLLCKYVSFDTQWQILRELENRARSESEASMIVESPVLAKVLKLLESPNADIRNKTCRLVLNLTSYEPTVSVILELNPCVALVSLLRESSFISDEYPQVVEQAIQSLATAAHKQDGTHAVIQATAQDHALELLESPNPVVREWTCRLVQNLAHYEPTAVMILLGTRKVQLPAEQTENPPSKQR